MCVWGVGRCGGFRGGVEDLGIGCLSGSALLHPGSGGSSQVSLGLGLGGCRGLGVLSGTDTPPG